jgi:hypothetical protein
MNADPKRTALKTMIRPNCLSERLNLGRISRTEFAPPKLVATTWRKIADVVYYIERFLVPELGDSITQSVRILDFRERREIVYVGGRRLRETATFSTSDETNE